MLLWVLKAFNKVKGAWFNPTGKQVKIRVTLKKEATASFFKNI